MSSRAQVKQRKQYIDPMKLQTGEFQNRPIRHYPFVHCIYRVRDSIPAHLLRQAQDDYRDTLAGLRLRYPDYQNPQSADAKAFQQAKSSFLDDTQHQYDKLLHQFHNRKMTLESAAAKSVILGSWLDMERMGWVEVFALSVMSNHVHVLCRHPEPDGVVDLYELFDPHFRFTSRRLNRLQDQKGRKVWAEKVFDRDVRPGKFATVLWYILNNPVKARLTSDPLNWVGNYVKPGLVSG